MCLKVYKLELLESIRFNIEYRGGVGRDIIAWSGDAISHLFTFSGY